MNKKKIKIKYCSYCGFPMIEELIPADKAMCSYGDFCEDMPFDSKFDEETGKRQFVKNYKCPNKPTGFFKKLFNNHDEWFEEKIILK